MKIHRIYLLGLLLIMLSCAKDDPIIVKKTVDIEVLSPRQYGDTVIFQGKIEKEGVGNLQNAVILLGEKMEIVSLICKELSTRIIDVGYYYMNDFQYFLQETLKDSDYGSYVNNNSLKKAIVGIDGGITSEGIQLDRNKIYYYSIIASSGRQLISSKVTSIILEENVLFDDIEIKNAIEAKFAVRYYLTNKENVKNVGFCWNTTGNPSLADSKEIDHEPNRKDSVVCSLKDKIGMGRYYVKAFLEFDDGSMSYSKEQVYDNRSERGIHTLADFMEFATKGYSYKWLNEDGEIALYADLDLSTIDSWYAIAGRSKEYFKHVFNGNNHVIKNLEFVKGNIAFLFYKIQKGGVIKNLILSDVDASDITSTGLEGWEVASGSAGFCAENYGIIQNCIFMGRTNCNISFSGFCSYNVGQIIDCMNNANIESISSCGFAEYNSGIIENCSNNGIIKSNSMRGSAYGFCGRNDHTNGNEGIIRKCVNTGRIEAEERASGFVYINSGPIEDCVNRGDIFTLLKDDGCSSGCANENSGYVSSFENSGIIQGAISAGVICYNVGEIAKSTNQNNVDGTKLAGGISSSNASKIDGAINYGKITSGNNGIAGDITGKNTYKGIIINCISYGSGKQIGKDGVQYVR